VQRKSLQALLEQVAAGAVSSEEALARLRHWPLEDLGFARVDHQRGLRTAAAEVIFGGGKEPAEMAAIARAIAAQAGNLLITRASAAGFAAVRAELPEALFYARSGVITWRREAPPSLPGPVVVVSAGTSDGGVAEEAELTAEAMGCAVERIRDAGVAGLHRLLAELERLRRARVLIVVAGMEGALASVVAGLVAAPVIAVPTSVGYGAAFGGVAALLAMLNACAANVAVVNIDNGFGAGSMAAAICRKAGSQ
jgi:pyridinium-3,5-biscarboxylic acid mononucleotide synthase